MRSFDTAKQAKGMLTQEDGQIEKEQSKRDRLRI